MLLKSAPNALPMAANRIQPSNLKQLPLERLAHLLASTDIYTQWHLRSLQVKAHSLSKHSTTFVSSLHVFIVHLVALWSLLVGNGSLLTHGRDDRDNQVLALVEVGLDLVTNLALRHLDIVLGVTVSGHQGQETVVDVQQLVVLSGDVWHLHVVGRWRQILQLLAGENVNGNQVHLGVAVLTGLGGGHVDNLTRSALDDNVTVLSQRRTLHWVGQGGTSVSGLKGVLPVSISWNGEHGEKWILERKTRHCGLLHLTRTAHCFFSGYILLRQP